MRTVLKKPIYIRYENLKHIVLYELLSQHDHAELDAKLNEAAWWSTLLGKKSKYLLKAEPNLLYTLVQTFTNMSNETNLLHAVISKYVNVIARAPSKPERREDRRKKGIKGELRSSTHHAHAHTSP